MASVPDRGGQPQRMEQRQPSAPQSSAAQPDGLAELRAELAEMRAKLDALHEQVNS